jgi:hypothetical protein
MRGQIKVRIYEIMMVLDQVGGVWVLRFLFGFVVSHLYTYECHKDYSTQR